jgi:hypothetical protein
MYLYYNIEISVIHGRNYLADPIYNILYRIVQFG